MIAGSLIDISIPSLHPNDTMRRAEQVMRELRLLHLPVVLDDKFVALLAMEDLEGKSKDGKIKDLTLQRKNSVLNQAHFFEIWSQLAEEQLSCIAVVDEQDNYKGSISRDSLIQFYARSFALTDPGCIVVISMRKMDYSLAKIAALVEEEGYVILSNFVSEKAVNNEILITLKLNGIDPQPIINTLTRHDIDIVGVFSEDEFSDSIKDRYNLLMSYLNV